MAQELSFSSPKREKERTSILLDGEQLWARRPKAAKLIEIMRMVNMEDSTDPSNVDALDEFLDQVMEPDTAARLRERMDDADDDFDIDTLVVIMEGLQETWSARPTGSGSASPAPPARKRSARRSTASVRSLA